MNPSPKKARCQKMLKSLGHLDSLKQYSTKNYTPKQGNKEKHEEHTLWKSPKKSLTPGFSHFSSSTQLALCPLRSSFVSTSRPKSSTAWSQRVAKEDKTQEMWITSTRKTSTALHSVFPRAMPFFLEKRWTLDKWISKEV